MIQRELYETKEDGRHLYRIYSDTDHKISDSDGQVYDEVIHYEDSEYSETEEYVGVDGSESYDDIVEALGITRKINHIGLTDNEALSVMELYPRWESKIGKTIEQGYITLYADRLWRARQTHTTLEIYPPSITTSALYEVVEREHSGEADDPIPYAPPMEIFEGKHYVEDGIIYRCTRDSGVALSHSLSALVGIYVEEVK